MSYAFYDVLNVLGMATTTKEYEWLGLRVGYFYAWLFCANTRPRLLKAWLLCMMLYGVLALGLRR